MDFTEYPYVFENDPDIMFVSRSFGFLPYDFP